MVFNNAFLIHFEQNHVNIKRFFNIYMQCIKCFYWFNIIIDTASVNDDVKSIKHYADVIMTTMASQITSITVVYSTVYSDADQRKHQSSASLTFVWGIHRDRWIPRTKGQLRGKCFHLMTSSWAFKFWHLLSEWAAIAGPIHFAVNIPNPSNPVSRLQKLWRSHRILDSFTVSMDSSDG